MIIECVKCAKKFEVKSELIPDAGRTIQCGSCNHIWFFKKNEFQENSLEKKINENDTDLVSNKKIYEEKLKTTRNISPKLKRKESQQSIPKGRSIVKVNKSNASFSLSNLLSYILVTIISFVGIIVVIDTFKSPLYLMIPKLEFIMFNFYEILRDIKLFILDLF